MKDLYSHGLPIPSMEDLEEYVKQGYLRSSDHPELPLRLYTYTTATQYEGKWDNVTLMSRTLVFDVSTKEFVTRGFTKFFNYDEISDQIQPQCNYHAFEKFDGSFCMLFWYHDRWVFTSRGAFGSDVAIKFKELMIEKIQESDLSHFFDADMTYYFELVGPSFRIVNKYHIDELIYIGSFDQSLMIEYPPIQPPNGIIFRSPAVIKFDFFDETFYLDLKHPRENFEGWVVIGNDNSKFKIKLDEYKRLHFLLTNTTKRNLWEILMNKDPYTELLEDVPDEFYHWVKSSMEELQNNFDDIYYESIHLGLKYRKKFKESNMEYRDFKKEMFNEIKGLRDKHHILAFFDERTMENDIWKRIKPGPQNPFDN